MPTNHTAESTETTETETSIPDFTKSLTVKGISLVYNNNGIKQETIVTLRQGLKTLKMSFQV